MKKFLAIFIFGCLVGTTNAQILDTTDTYLYRPFEIRYISESDFILMDYADTQRLDTSLFGFENYYPAYKNHFPMIDLGFEYSPFYDLGKNLTLQRKFQMGLDNDNQAFVKDDVPIFFASKPYTRLNYSQGPNEMIFTEVKHYNPVSNRLKLGIDYKRLKNQNIYYANMTGGNVARLSDVFNVHLFGQILGKERKYELLTAITWNKWNTGVNGEMLNDTFYMRSNPAARALNVLGSVSNAINANVETGFKTVQIFRLGGQKADSNSLYDLSRFSHQVVWTSRLKRHHLKYVDASPNPNYYPTGIDSSFFNEIRHSTFENEWKYVLSKKNQILSAGLNYAMDGIRWDSTVNQSFQNISLITDNRFQLLNNLKLITSGYLNVLGYNIGDWDVNGVVAYQNKEAKLCAGIHLQRIRPYFLMEEFRSIIINYQSNFNPTQTQSLFASAEIKNEKNWKIGAESRLENQLGMIYFRGFGAPEQWNSNIVLWKNTIPASIQLGGLHMAGTFIHQYTSQPILLPRPTISYQATVYGNVPLFKKTLMTQIGATLYGAGAFYAPMYQPFLRTWSYDNELFNPNTVLNIFINAYIKGFSFGVNYFNATHLFYSQPDFASPSYPILPGSIRVNVRWDLYN